MTSRASHRPCATLEADPAIPNHGGSAVLSRQLPKQAKRPPRAGRPRVASSCLRPDSAMPRSSDGLQTNGEKRLKCSKGDQKSDERVLDRLAAPPALFQAAEVFRGQRLATNGVQIIAPDNRLFVSYRSADPEAVTGITVPRAFLCVGSATAIELPIRRGFVCGNALTRGNGRLVWSVKIGQRSTP